MIIPNVVAKQIFIIRLHYTKAQQLYDELLGNIILYDMNSKIGHYWYVNMIEKYRFISVGGKFSLIRSIIHLVTTIGTIV